MSQNHLRFEGLAEVYDLRRPGFPPGAFEALLARAPAEGPRLLVDVGAGTGLATRGFMAVAPESWRAIAVEPGADMRRRGAERLAEEPRATVIEGAAEALPIEDGSVSIVIAARALHWFDQPAFFGEARRVLAPDGVVAGLFNRIDPHPALDAAEAFFEEEGSDLVRRGNYDANTFAAFEAAEGFGPTERVEIPWRVEVDDEGLVGMLFSRSRLRGVIDRLGEEETRRRVLDVIADAAPGPRPHVLDHHSVLAIARRG
ncbi:MAG: methyltransferase domain-containing protein [Pseudomonadota bacterium]